MKKKDTKKELEDITALLKKVQADFENYQKRMEKEKKQFIELANQEFAAALLPLLDSFDQAMKNAGSNDIKALHDQLMGLLAKQGVSRIETEGRKFDPYLHEALMQEKSDRPEGEIIEELQAGYKFKDSVIRNAKVKIAKK